MPTNFRTNCLLGLVILIATAAALAEVMRSFDHNEHMYVSAAVLVSQGGELYEDFAYLQTPYLPLLYGALYNALGITSYYLLTAKLVSFLFLGVSALLIFALARRITNDVALSLGIAALFLLNTTILRAATEASNYIVPVAFSIAAFYVFHLAVGSNSSRPFLSAMAGLLLAIAVGTKLTYASTIVAYVAVITWQALKPDRVAGSSLARALVPFLGGVALGLLPVFFYLASDPDSFLFNNLGIHNLTGQWRRDAGHSGPISFGGKLTFAHTMFSKSDNVILILGVLFGVAGALRRPLGDRLNIGRISAPAGVAALLVPIALATVLAPTPSFPQYYAMPVSLLFLPLIYAHRPQTPEAARLCRAVIMMLLLVSVAYRGPALLDSIQTLGTEAGWRGLQVRAVSARMRQSLIDNGIGAECKLATLSPVFAIEAGLPIYAQLATGPFLYRVGDLLTPEQRQHFVGTSPKSIAGLLSADPPGAILVGFEGALDKPLVEYATANNYKSVEVAGLGGKLYVRP